jgi:hypothetical protein
MNTIKTIHYKEDGLNRSLYVFEDKTLVIELYDSRYNLKESGLTKEQTKELYLALKKVFEK